MRGVVEAYPWRTAARPFERQGPVSLSSAFMPAPARHVIGHSYGGAVALKAALVRPARLRSLILFEPVLFAVLMAADPRQPAAQEIAAVRDDTVAAVDRGDLDSAGGRFVDYWWQAR